LVSHALDKIVPENSRWILQHADENGNVRAVFLDGGARMAFLDGEEFTQLAESRETPVALFSDKSVVGVWRMRSAWD
jgi:hypothetical protein